MNKLIKTILATLILATLAFALVGCSKKESTGNDTSEVVTQESEVTFDGKHFSLMGKNIIVGETTGAELNEMLYSDEFLSDTVLDPDATMYYKYYINGDESDWIGISYYNPTTGPLAYSECVAAGFHYNDNEAYTIKTNSLATGETFTFDIGGITEKSKYEDVVKILGEPNKARTEETDTYTKYIWGNTLTEGYKFFAFFNTDGDMCGAGFVSYVK